MHHPINELHKHALVPKVAGFDPELMYVECEECGRPVLWTKGRTSQIIDGAGISRTDLDSTCVIMTKGCPSCHRGEREFKLEIIKVDPAFAKKLNELGVGHA